MGRGGLKRSNNHSIVRFIVREHVESVWRKKATSKSVCRKEINLN